MGELVGKSPALKTEGLQNGHLPKPPRILVSGERRTVTAFGKTFKFNPSEQWLVFQRLAITPREPVVTLTITEDTGVDNIAHVVNRMCETLNAPDEEIIRVQKGNRKKPGTVMLNAIPEYIGKPLTETAPFAFDEYLAREAHDMPNRITVPVSYYNTGFDKYRAVIKTEGFKRKPIDLKFTELKALLAFCTHPSLLSEPLDKFRLRLVEDEGLPFEYIDQVDAAIKGLDKKLHTWGAGFVLSQDKMLSVVKYKPKTKPLAIPHYIPSEDTQEEEILAGTRKRRYIPSYAKGKI